MNERIHELAVQIGFPMDYENPAWAYEQSIYEFALLIVRECLNQCYFRGMNDELYAGQLKAAAYIEEHFGVES